MKKIVLSTILVTSLFSGSVYAAPAKPAPKPAAKITATPITYSQTQINTLKLYSRIAQHYYTLQLLGDKLSHTTPGLTIAMLDLVDGQGSEALDGNVNDLASLTEQYNNMIPLTENLIAEAAKKGINLTNMREILNKYSAGIDAYENAAKTLYAYEESKNKGYNDEAQKQYDLSSQHHAYATDIMFDGETIAYQSLQDFFNKIETFK